MRLRTHPDLSISDAMISAEIRSRPVAALPGPQSIRFARSNTVALLHLRIEYGVDGITSHAFSIRCEKRIQPSVLIHRRPLIISNVQPKPSGITQILDARSKMRIIEINPRIRKFIAKHGVARTCIAVANDFTPVAQFEVRGCIVKCAQEPRRRMNLRRRERAQFGRDSPRHERQDLTALFVDPQELRRTVKSLRRQVRQQLVHERRSRPHRPPSGISDSDDAGRGPSAGERQFRGVQAAKD